MTLYGTQGSGSFFPRGQSDAHFSAAPMWNCCSVYSTISRSVAMAEPADRQEQREAWIVYQATDGIVSGTVILEAERVRVGNRNVLLPTLIPSLLGGRTAGQVPASSSAATGGRGMTGGHFRYFVGTRRFSSSTQFNTTLMLVTGADSVAGRRVFKRNRPSDVTSNPLAGTSPSM